MRRDTDRLRKAWNVSGRRGETLAEDMQIFLGDLCKGGGFCSAPVDDILHGHETLSADAFAKSWAISFSTA